MDGAGLLALVRFHARANDRILSTAAGLSDEELRRAAVLDHGSAFQTFRNLVDVDWSWRVPCIGNDVGDSYVWDHGFALDDLPAIHAFCLDEAPACGATWSPSTTRRWASRSRSAPTPTTRSPGG